MKELANGMGSLAVYSEHAFVCMRVPVVGCASVRGQAFYLFYTIGSWCTGGM